MHYIRVLGGLGNQMFQYTFAKYVEKVSGSPTTLHLNYFEDVKAVLGATIRIFDLDKMNTLYRPLYGNVACSQIINETDAWDPSMKDLYFNGYWQDKKYYECVKDQVSRDFELKNEYITQSMRQVIDLMKNTNSVSLHVRRTDYLTENMTVSDDYYGEALEVIREFENDLMVFVFSDDPDYAQGLMGWLGLPDYQLMPMREAYQDIYLMSMTRHHIIANSTFSWWGAALGQQRDEQSMVIAPKVWFKDGPPPDLYLDKWISI